LGLLLGGSFSGTFLRRPKEIWGNFGWEKFWEGHPNVRFTSHTLGANWVVWGTFFPLCEVEKIPGKIGWGRIYWGGNFGDIRGFPLYNVLHTFFGPTTFLSGSHCSEKTSGVWELSYCRGAFSEHKEALENRPLGG